MTYQELIQEFIDSVQKGQVPAYIAKLNEVLKARPFDFSVWLFVARAYESIGDIDNASNSYEHLLRLSIPDHESTLELTDEIQEFLRRHKGREKLAKLIAELKAAPADLPASVPAPARPAPAPASAKPAPVTEAKPRPTPAPLPTAAKAAPAAKTPAAPAASASAAPVNPKAELIKSLIADANRLIQKGELESGLGQFQKAVKQGDNSVSTYFVIAQTLQRMKRMPEALSYLDRGIQKASGQQRLALINLKAQIYSSQRDWESSLREYNIIITEDNRPALRRFSMLQVAGIHRRLRQWDEAKRVLEKVLKEYPQDQVTLSLLSTIERLAADPVAAALDGPSQAELNELNVDAQDEGLDAGIALISPMLSRDLALAEFRDEMILRKGGQPDLSDADRLLDKAEATKSTEFGERYPEFLEAAKAYSNLPDGTYDLDRFYRSLARYAMLKGGALVSDLRRSIFSGQVNLVELSRLKDSASSYYLESLALQVRLDRNMALIPLTNLMRAQAAYKLISIGEAVPNDLFQWKFSDLFKFCNEHPNESITRMAYESVVALGAASGYMWNQLNQVKGGTGMLAGMLNEQASRKRPYAIISQITGREFNPNKPPVEILQAAFLARRNMTKEMLGFLYAQQQTPLMVENFRTLSTQWGMFPHPAALTDTDREVLNGIVAILGILSPYQTRKAEERTGILFTARNNIESLLNLIKNSPTNWGRVGFEPLLTRWQTSLRGIEQKRLNDIQPELTTRLDPPVFHLHEDFIQSSIVINNEGKGTAEGAVIRVRLSSYDTHLVLREFELKVEQEIPPGGHHFETLQFETDHLATGLDKPYHLKLEIAPGTLPSAADFKSQEYTLEVLKGSSLSLADIPWNEVEIPPRQLFKGRERLIEKLAKHLFSDERNKTYILYGLTRTGKSSILSYLARRIELADLTINKRGHRLITFEWNMGTANAQSSAKDMWEYLLEQGVINKLQKLADEGRLAPDDIPPQRPAGNLRFKDWGAILDFLKDRAIYPIFLVDEFSYFRSLVDSKRIDASFLAAIRQFAIDGKASFIFAGTYDLRKLVRDPAYGITGQLVNAIELKVSSIDKDPAVELIQTLGDQLRFTEDAVEHILQLSHRIPYFVQLICKNCAKYAVTSQRAILGYPEVEYVVLALTGNEQFSDQLGIPPMASGVFMNNMQTPTDPPEFSALISTICHLSTNPQHPRKITYPEIQAVWDKNRVRLFQARLANAIKELLDREVLVESEDEGIPAYKISVDLFRRWWSNEHRNLNLELDALKEES